ncbi:MAG: threo-3-hydroxy-L-aspartate ammonia-lyase [Gemmatimonadaceae bacterium]|nr:threo-3-hydroxy-L-aspartate ammonia-lyase [Gemmatimonadaceae bacterium]
MTRPDAPPALPTFADVEAARARLAGIAHRTPVVRSRTLDAMVGAEVHLKCENLQRVGAFKFRGGYNALAAIPAHERHRGVVAFSSGNHAQAVALAAQLLGIPATIVMPRTAPVAKREATAGYGARVVLFDPSEDAREVVAQRLVAETGAMLVPPFDHPDVIAGQGTAAAELFEEAGPLDALLVCVGGGGLLSGSALAARAMAPGCRVIGVEPELGDDVTRSFRTRSLQRLADVPATIADGARTLAPGALTLPLVLANVDEMVTVPDAALVAAVRFMLERCKLLCEPSGVLGLAALTSGAVRVTGRVGVIVSGGNVDAELLRWILLPDAERPATPPTP